MSSMRFMQSRDVAWNYLGDHIVAFTLSGEKEFHDLNSTAASIFQALESPKSENELVAALVAEFDISPDSAVIDVRSVLASMKEKKLITAE